MSAVRWPLEGEERGGQATAVESECNASQHSKHKPDTGLNERKASSRNPSPLVCVMEFVVVCRYKFTVFEEVDLTIQRVL